MIILVVGVNIDPEAFDAEHLVQGLVSVFLGESVKKADLPVTIGSLNRELSQSKAH